MRIILLLSFFTLFSYANMGEILYQGNCHTCHGYDKANSAPSAKAIQQRYKEVFEEKEAFIDFMREWIKLPKEESALMPDEIRKHGLMPILGYDDFTLNEVGNYLFET
ncbi:MAG: cytochrome C, partial [Sulfurospirillaceae bacterium]|nr:cytochrome C [Sulfurospirillaceae bacterium]